MKTPPESSGSEFNSPAEILARAGYLVCLASATAGILLVLAGLVSLQVRLVVGGLLALAIAWLCHGWLRRHNRLARVAEAFDSFGDEGELSADNPHVIQFVALLHQRDALEQQRGSPGFDPWAMQTVRRDIQKMVDQDPALDRLFRT